MQGFRDLKVWEKAHRLTLGIYNTTLKFPHNEIYGLTSQMRRASASIPANLAEGCGRIGRAEFKRFCSIAMGSASELEYHLLLARDLEFLASDEHATLTEQVVEVKRMLSALAESLKADD